MRILMNEKVVKTSTCTLRINVVVTRLPFYSVQPFSLCGSLDIRVPFHVLRRMCHVVLHMALALFRLGD